MYVQISEKYKDPIHEKCVTAILLRQMSSAVKVGDEITISFDGCFDFDDYNATITNVERVRLDELKTRHIVALGYAHRSILEYNLMKETQMGKNPLRTSLFYYIEFDETGKKIRDMYGI